MAPYQFTVGAFDGVVLFHPLLKGFDLHFQPAPLSPSMVLAHHQGSMLLPSGNTLSPPRAIVTVRAPFKAVADLARLLFFETAALSAQLAGRTERSTLFDFDLKGIGLEGRSARLSWRLGWAQQLTPFNFRFSQSLA